jgi:pimeloyl-ACP methyl ester carboxylesterase
MGASGGGPPALACAALMPERVTGVVCLAGLAPYTGDPDWFDGMVDPGGPQAALEGREARARYAETAEFDERSFTAADYDILAGAWKSLGADAGHAGTTWPDGLVDDDVASVNPWGFELAQVEAPVLVVQGGEDRVIPAAHAQQLLRGCPRAELWLRPRDGHVSILAAVPLAMDWLRIYAT